MDLAKPATGARATRLASSRVAGVLLFVLAAQFMLVIMLAASIAPDYDYGAAAISDLGVITQTALLFNVSLLAVGVLNIIGGYLHYRSHRKAWALALFVLAGLGAIGAGSFPSTALAHTACSRSWRSWRSTWRLSPWRQWCRGR